MSEQERKEQWCDLGRRDLLKLGAAAGLIANIPAGLILKGGPAVANAAVGTNTLGVAPPTLDELSRIAQQYYLHLSKDDFKVYQSIIDGALGSYRRLSELDEPMLPVKYPRSTGYRPPESQNPLNAWYWRCSVKGANAGKLAGKKIALKDNICLAGIPMMNGSAILEGFIPDWQVRVTVRILSVKRSPSQD